MAVIMGQRQLLCVHGFDFQTQGTIPGRELFCFFFQGHNLIMANDGFVVGHLVYNHMIDGRSHILANYCSMQQQRQKQQQRQQRVNKTNSVYRATKNSCVEKNLFCLTRSFLIG